MEALAWIVLRLVYAWMFLWPLKALFADWKGAEGLIALLCPKALVPLGAKLMIVVMIAGALSILLGVLPRVGGAMLCVYSLLGAKVHYKLAATAAEAKLGDTATDADRATLTGVSTLATVGHVTSAEKNFVLAAVGFFFAIMGSGPYSLFQL